MRRRSGYLVLVAVVLVASGCAQSWQSSLVSQNTAGDDSGDSWSGRVDNPTHRIDYVFSPDGSKMAFISAAGDLSTPPGGTHTNVYVSDLSSGDTTLVSVNSAGTAGAFGDSYDPVFSPDGTKLAFVSVAGNLDPLDVDTGHDVFVRDLTAGTTSVVSRNAAGTASANGMTVDPVFAPDGGSIAFRSTATDFGPADTDSCPQPPFQIPRPCFDIYLTDLASGTTALVSADATGSSVVPVDVLAPAAFSPDGETLAFDSRESLLPIDTNNRTDIYLRELGSGTSTLLSTNAAGTNGGNGESFSPVFSPDGSRVLYGSDASDTGTVDTDSEADIFVRDLATGAITLVSANADGTGSGNGPSTDPVFNRDGTKVAFVSYSTDLVPPDQYQDGGCETDVALYMHDLVAGATVQVGNDDPEGLFCVGSMRPGAFSAVSDVLAFTAYGVPALAAQDTNGASDVFAFDPATGTYSIVSLDAAGEHSANGHSASPVWSPVAEKVAFYSRADNLGATDTNALYDLYLAAPR